MSLTRYERTTEAVDATALDLNTSVPVAEVEAALASCQLTEGARDLVRGLCRLGRPAIFPGGGVGIEYGSLLKTAANPAYLRRHVHEAAAHLREERVDLLVVPGMSGYPIGSMYAIVAELPAILLAKRPLARVLAGDYPTGSFVIPSYTGEGDVVMSADLVAAQDSVDRILTAQLAAQSDAGPVRLSLRLAGADDIIDKATMSQAVSESGIRIGTVAAESFVTRHRERTGDRREIAVDVTIAAWVTPLMKGYNRPQHRLRRLFGVTPFAGLTITGLHVDPSAIGIAGLGVLSLPGAG